MTSATPAMASTPAAAARRRVRPAFTLVEMLVVLAIISVLAAFLIPTIFSMRRQAERTRIRNDLNAISVALDEYKKDFRDYPRPGEAFRGTTTDNRRLVLAWALVGALPAASDGYEGLGFKVDPTVGKVYGPYLPADKIRLSSDKYALVDFNGKPIDYYPRWRTYRPIPASPMSLFGTWGSNPSSALTVYDYRQCKEFPGGSSIGDSLNYLRKALGDDDLSDRINGAEEPKDMPEYLLISRGPDKVFSTTVQVTKQFAKCGEVSNVSP